MKTVHISSPLNSFNIFQTTIALDHSLSSINISTKFINGLFIVTRLTRSEYEDVPERHP